MTDTADPAGSPDGDQAAGPIRRKRWPFVIGGLGGLAVVALALFQPWKLFVDVTVDEAAPVAAAPASSTSPTAPASPGLAPAAPSTPGGSTAPSTADPATPTGAGTSGQPSTAVTSPPPSGLTSFVSHSHGTSGQLRVTDTAEGPVVRIENLDTDNGPDVIVVLSTNEASNPALGENVSLGDIKGNRGNQNYRIPATVDLGDLTSVTIWCDRFSVSFGAAELVAA